MNIIKNILFSAYKIYFRFKHKFPYNESWALDQTFIDLMYTRVNYFITTKRKLSEPKKYEIKAYNEMLDLIQWLKDNYKYYDKESEDKYKRFLLLFTRYSRGLWD